MRTILIAIALTFFGMMYGQIATGEYYRGNDTVALADVTLEQAKWLIDDSDFCLAVIFENRLRELYIEYCYADSAYYEEWIYTHSDLREDGFVDKDYFDLKKVKTHPKEYPTFEGYTEWLGNILKEK